MVTQSLQLFPSQKKANPSITIQNTSANFGFTILLATLSGKWPLQFELYANFLHCFLVSFDSVTSNKLKTQQATHLTTPSISMVATDVAVGENLQCVIEE